MRKLAVHGRVVRCHPSYKVVKVTGQCILERKKRKTGRKKSISKETVRMSMCMYVTFIDPNMPVKP